jgi:hypothetical protein
VSFFTWKTQMNLDGIPPGGCMPKKQNTTLTERQLEILRRGGRDHYSMDRRPLREAMNDEIPYARWEKALNVLRCAGFNSLSEKLYGISGKICGKSGQDEGYT